MCDRNFIFGVCVPSLLHDHCNQEGLTIVLNLICHLVVLKISISYFSLNI